MTPPPHALSDVAAALEAMHAVAAADVCERPDIDPGPADDVLEVVCAPDCDVVPSHVLRRLVTAGVSIVSVSPQGNPPHLHIVAV